MEKSMEKDGYKFSRFMYILEAAFEYFIALLAEGAYLAKVTTAIELAGVLRTLPCLNKMIRKRKDGELQKF